MSKTGSQLNPQFITMVTRPCAVCVVLLLPHHCSFPRLCDSALLTPPFGGALHAPRLDLLALTNPQSVVFLYRLCVCLNLCSASALCLSLWTAQNPPEPSAAQSMCMLPKSPLFCSAVATALLHPGWAAFPFLSGISSRSGRWGTLSECYELQSSPQL